MRMIALVGMFLCLGSSVRADVITESDTPVFDTNLRLSLAEAMDEPAMSDAAAPPHRGEAFAAGTWTFQAYGSASVFADTGEIYQGHVGVGYHLWDGVSVNIEGVFGYVDANQPSVNNGFTSGVDLLFRCHVIRERDFSIYIEGGAGLIWFEDEFPRRGTHQNFTPQAGLGFTYRLGESVRLMAGARWHHVSNANKSGVDSNPGYDAAMFYAGVMLPF